MLIEEKRNILRLALSEGGTLQDGILLCTGQDWFEGIKLILAFKDCSGLNIENFMLITGFYERYKLEMTLIYTNKFVYEIEPSEYVALELHKIEPKGFVRCIAPCSSYRIASEIFAHQSRAMFDITDSAKSLVCEAAVAARNWAFVHRFFCADCSDAEYFDYVKALIKEGKEYQPAQLVITLIQRYNMDMKGIDGFYIAWKEMGRNGKEEEKTCILVGKEFEKAERSSKTYSTVTDNKKEFITKNIPFTKGQIKKGMASGEIIVKNFALLSRYLAK